MKLSGFGWVRNMSSQIRLCLCLVLILVTTAGAIVYTEQSSRSEMLPGVQVCQAEPLQQNEAVYAPAAIGGNGPVIQVFKAAPMELDAADSAAVYTFKVKLATKLQIIEAGTNIRDINNPSGATLQGDVTGLPAGAIPTDDSGKFVCTIVATNEYGTDTKALELSLAKELLPGVPPPESTANQTKNKSRWLEQTGIQTTLPPATSTTNPNEPEFFKCPENCKYCLQPGDAASLGFTQRCSDQRCFYDTDNKRSWYCYSEPEGWCCANQQVSQTTRSRCTQIGGYWSLNQYDAVQACQPRGYCCYNGQVYGPVTKEECVLRGGSYWSTSQAEVMQYCTPPSCWCCVKGQVYQTDQARCIQSGGACYASESQAAAACYEPPIRPPTSLK